MSDDTSKPYVMSEPATTADGKPYDACYLVYRGQRLPVTPTEHSLLQELLGAGLDLARASKGREALTPKSGHSRKKIIRSETAGVRLSHLRRKIAKEFPDLVIPRAMARSRSRLRLMTVTECDEIRHRIAHPQNGAYVDFDESGLSHLFINGKEMTPVSCPENNIGPSHLALVSILLVGELERVFGRQPVRVKRGDPLFLATWCELTGGTGISRGVFTGYLRSLRRALEPAGLTITPAPSGNRHDTHAHSLIPFEPARPAKDKMSPQALAAG